MKWSQKFTTTTYQNHEFYIQFTLHFKNKFLSIFLEVKLNLNTEFGFWFRLSDVTNSLVFKVRVDHWNKKRSHFDLKSWVTGCTKIRPGIPSNWRIFELKWLEIDSQYRVKIDSQYRVNFTQIFSNYSESRVEF